MLGAGLLLAAREARAQSPRRPRVGFISSSGRTAESNRIVRGMRAELAARDYVEPDTLELIYRTDDSDKFPSLVQEVIAARVSVIVIGGTNGVRTAMTATRTIPIVCSGANDMVGSGLIASLARPGGNVTGVSMLVTENSTKQLELLTEMLPDIARVAVLRGPAGGTADRIVASIRVAAAARGIDARGYQVDSVGDASAAFEAMEATQRQAVIIVDGPFINRYHALIANLAAARRLPAMSTSPNYVEAGTLASYGPSEAAQGQRVANYIDRILKGAMPADLPAERPTRFELVINLKSAKLLGLTIPPVVLVRADEVIE